MFLNNTLQSSWFPNADLQAALQTNGRPEKPMNSTKRHAQIFGTSVLALLVGCMVGVQPTRSAARLAADDIAGTVTSAHGAEAGVWVIAETRDFQTRFAKIVVTDKAGRYLIPELPKATYSVWVRGYGLADSPKVDAAPGHALDLTALIAPDAGAAAKAYPAAYWYAMMKIPEEAQVATLPGGRNGYLMWMKNMGCVGCHQLGNLATRTIPKSLGPFESSEAVWLRRVQSGQAGGGLGANVPIATGNLFDGVHAFVNGKFVTLRIPYPLGFYAKGLDGRIDDAAAGWKGRGIWITSGDRTPWHKEGGKGTKPMVVHFQVRPSPLAD
jgi:hypothetical protein